MEEELTMTYPAISNVQSYPSVGGNWTVRFNTTGKANLTITAVNGTTWTSPLVSLVVMSASFENNSIFLDLEGKNKTSDVDSFIIAAISPEILEMLDGCFIAVNDLINLLSDCDGECLVPMSELVKQAFEFGRDNELK